MKNKLNAAARRLPARTAEQNMDMDQGERNALPAGTAEPNLPPGPSHANADAARPHTQRSAGAGRKAKPEGRPKLRLWDRTVY